jgi:hypothetical protein
MEAERSGSLLPDCWLSPLPNMGYVDDDRLDVARELSPCSKGIWKLDRKRCDGGCGDTHVGRVRGLYSKSYLRGLRVEIEASEATRRDRGFRSYASRYRMASFRNGQCCRHPINM